MANAYRKGYLAEREIAGILTELTGEEFRRLGGTEKSKVFLSGDVVPANPQSKYRSFHFEIKNRKSIAITDWYKKAKDDSRYKTPIVIFWDRKLKTWLAALELKNLFKLNQNET